MTPVSAHDVARELRRQRPSAGDVKIHKLLYYCQGWHLAATGEPLFAEGIQAWSNGPVVANLWRDEKYDNPLPEPIALSREASETISHVLSQYGHLSGVDLIRLTHSERPWKEISERDSWDQTIPPNLLAEHFSMDEAAYRYSALRKYAKKQLTTDRHAEWLAEVQDDIAAGGKMRSYDAAELREFFKLDA